MGNINSYRFVPKKFGYGLVPISRQGWVVSLIFMGLCLLSAYSNYFFSSTDPSPQQVVRFFMDILMLSCGFVMLIKDKTNGELKRRGSREDDLF